jgi:hypothetical protein
MKRLVYFTVGVSRGYADLLRLAVHSLLRTTPDVDVLASVRQAAAALSMRGLAGYAAVVDAQGRAAGVLLAQDLFAAASRAD